LRLVLPETGVCTTQFARADDAASSACCGGPAPKEIDACCVADAEAKTTTGQGCGRSNSAKPSHRVVELV
jgi:hypothetical protein